MTPPRIPGYPGQALPPPRLRAKSQPDAEVPEPVYHALQGVTEAVTRLDKKLDLHAEATEKRLTDQDKALAELKAGNADRILNLVKVIVPAIATMIGGTVGLQKLTADKPQPAEVRAIRSSADLALDECRPLRPGSYERAECFERVSRGPDRPGR
jgi:hypothetical protein